MMRNSVFLRNPAIVPFERPISLWLLTFRQFDLFLANLLPRNHVEQVGNAIEPGARFVVSLNDIPRRLNGICGGKHCVPGARVVIPTAMGFQVHRAELPSAHRILDALEKAPVLLLFADFEPVLHNDDAVVLQQCFKAGAHSQECGILLVGAKLHHVFDQGTVVPTAIKQHYFTGRRQVLDVALRVHLGLFTVGGRRQRQMPENTRAHPLHDAVYHSAFARCVSAFEQDYEPRTTCPDPFLHLHELGLELAQLALVFLALELPLPGLGGHLSLALGTRHKASRTTGRTASSTGRSLPSLFRAKKLTISSGLACHAAKAIHGATYATGSEPPIVDG